ncbi:MAG: hypothetical protein ACI8XB_002056 [Patiriisocius sp.]|jgi:hypothetical protein
MKLYIYPLLLILCACTQTTNTKSETKAIEQDAVINDTTEELSATENVQTTEVSEVVSEKVSEEFEDLDWEDYELNMTKDFSFVILISTKSYEAALERAKDASNKLGYPIDLRGLHANTEIGLSLSKEVCENEICGGGMVDYPVYIPRNDWGESKYVSVEYSDGFRGFTKGYYIVVVSSGEKGDPIVQEALSESRKFYKDAYAKTCGVWMGCGC